MDFKLSKSVSNHISTRYGVRRVRDENDKTVFDYKILIKGNSWNLSVNLNNILNSKYYETNLVQMPGRNLTIGVNISF